MAEIGLETPSTRAGLGRRVGAEFLGTALLVAFVVGSGIMAVNLTSDVGLQLLINDVATIAGLGVLIWALLPVSGAHINPAVTAVALVQRDIPVRDGTGYLLAQFAGGLAGASLAHLMFSQALVQSAAIERTGPGLWLGEVVATAGLLLVIGVAQRTGRVSALPVLVPAWIGSAYLFTSSTSFANPAVTVGRAITDTFSGISPEDVPAFIAFQLLGAAIGALLAAALYPRENS
jgi:glycerol uptake facilitator-like aquaporin